MFSPYDPKQISRLRSAISWSRDKLRKYRRSYKQLIEQFVTERYYEDETMTEEDKTVVVNLLGMAVEIHSLHLAPQTPKVAVGSDFREYASVAYDFEIALERDFKQMDFGNVLREGVVDAWFSAGIFKLYYGEGRYIEIEGDSFDIGDLKLCSISIDNWVHDCSKKRLKECDFMGDLYQIRLDKIKANPEYQNVDRLVANQAVVHQGENEDGEADVASLSAGTAETEEATMVDYVEVWDIFLPHEQIVVTLPKDAPAQSEEYVLRVREWEGPKRGPYHMLQLSEVPQNIMPASPGMQLHELHSLVNNLFRKLKNQAKRQKDVNVAKHGTEEDAVRVSDARDGELISVADPSAVNSLRMGGIDAQNHGFAVHLMGLFDNQAGNLQMLGGLSPSADTLGQEQILQQQASARIQKHKGFVLQTVQEIAEDIAWYRWHDVFFSPTVVKQVPGTSVKVVSSFTPEDRIAKFVDFNFNIEPYSLEHMPPTAKANALSTLLLQTVMPLYPVLQEQGITINVEQVLKLLARYSNVPELIECIIFSNGEMAHSPQGKTMDSVMRPPVTRRENVRINQSGGSGSKDQGNLAANLLGRGGDSRPGMTQAGGY